LPEPPGQIKLNLCLYGWIKNDVCKINIDKPEELLTPILDAAACVKKCEDQLIRTTRDLRTRIAKCIEVDGGIFVHLL